MRALFFIPLVSIFGLGCAQRLDEVDEKINDLQHRASILEAKTGAPIGNDRELLEGQKLADVRSQLSSLRNEMTVMAGKVEALEYEAKRLSARTEAIAQDTEQKLRDLKKQSAGAQGLESSSAASAFSGSASESDFEKAMKAHQDGNYIEAEKGFEDFLKKNPKHAWASRAVFWIGDGYMAQKMYKKAIAKFQDLVDRYPKSDKRCDAMAKQVQAFKELKMDKEAKVFTQVRDGECK